MLVRVAAAVAILALATLVGSALFWPKPTDSNDPDAILSTFEDGNAPLLTIDIGSAYAGREELLETREVLPTWHRHPRAEAAMFYEATQSCPPRALAAPLADVSLAKAYAWFERTCAGGPVPEDLLEEPPYMHPSGKSYAAMAVARAGNDARALTKRHWRELHVLEIAASGADDEEARALSLLGSREWFGLLQGDRIVQTNERLVIAERGPLGLARLRFHDRVRWDRGAFALVPRSATPCTHAASTLLCWESKAPRRSASWQRSVTGVASSMAIASALVLGFAFVRERRRAALDRLHLLRTLTHEIRTPAMTLGLDIEPLRASYDDLPAHLQEPLLRISSGIARLHRVLHHSARALELFEGRGTLVSPTTIESTHELLKDFAEEWPKDVTLAWEGKDHALVIDAEWLAVAIRNLVENACKHGKPPVVVRAHFENDDLVVRVEDAGTTNDLSLKRVTSPWTRANKSAGLGLGLALVARIAKVLGGTLAHEPNPTAFVLRIPSKDRA